MQRNTHTTRKGLATIRWIGSLQIGSGKIALFATMFSGCKVVLAQFSVLPCTLPQALPCRHLFTLIVPLLRSYVLYCIVSLYAWLERASPVPSLTRLRSPEWFKNIQDMIAALRRLRYVSVLLLKSRSCFASIFSCLNGSSIF